MLFERRFHDGIRAGTTTLTFRAWKAPKAKVGGRYHLSPTDVVEVDAIDPVTVGAVGDREARRAGFADADDLVEYLRRRATSPVTARSRIFRVAFHHDSAAPGPPADAPADRESVAEVMQRLERMDRLSRRGPWTTRVLTLIAAHPRVAASRLAAQVDRETQPFKADVRKLKKLGLTRSFEVGYELTPLGRAVVKEE